MESNPFELMEEKEEEGKLFMKASCKKTGIEIYFG